ATDPATPTVPPPPAPDVAFASNTCLFDVAAPHVVAMPAQRLRPLLVLMMAAASILASLVTFPRLSATAAPMVAVPPFAALPSAVAVASESALLSKLT